MSFRIPKVLVSPSVSSSPARRGVIERLEGRQMMSATPVHTALVAPKSSPLVNIQVLASASANGPFTAALTVTPGEKVYYEVVAELAPVGTTYIGRKSYKITSKTSHPTTTSIGYDGINSLSLNLSESGAFTGVFSAAKLAANTTTGDNYNGSYASAGTASGAKLSGIFAIQAPGHFAAANSAEPVFTGSFTVSSKLTHGAKSTVAGAWGADYGGFGFNSNKSTGATATRVIITPTTESSSSHLVSFAALTLTAK